MILGILLGLIAICFFKPMGLFLNMKNSDCMKISSSYLLMSARGVLLVVFFASMQCNISLSNEFLYVMLLFKVSSLALLLYKQISLGNHIGLYFSHGIRSMYKKRLYLCGMRSSKSPVFNSAISVI